MNSHEATNESDDGVVGSHREYIFVGDEDFNFTKVPVDPEDPKITASEIAMAVRKHPVAEYVVLQLLKSGELESLRPTEVADIRGPSPNRFFVIKGFKSNRFVVEGLSMEWPRDYLVAKHVKFLVNASEEDALVQRLDGVDKEYADDEEVFIGADGLEEFKLRKKPKKIHVTYKDTKFELEDREYTPEELARIFGVPAGYVPDYIDEKGGFHDLKPGEPFHVKDGMEFASHPPHGQSS